METIHKRSYKIGRYAHENLINIFRHKENTNYIHVKILLHTHEHLKRVPSNLNLHRVFVGK